MDGQKAYNNWIMSHKIRLQVMTDEQMFMIGYETALKDVQESSQEKQEEEEQPKPAVKKAKVKKDE